MTGHFTKTTYSTLNYLITATKNNPHFVELIENHDYARRVYTTEGGYFEHMTNFTQQLVRDALPPEDTIEFLERLHPGLLFLYTAFNVRIVTLEKEAAAAKMMMQERMDATVKEAAAVAKMMMQERMDAMQERMEAQQTQLDENKGKEERTDKMQVELSELRQSEGQRLAREKVDL
jgi:hypothetical protein